MPKVKKVSNTVGRRVISEYFPCPAGPRIRASTTSRRMPITILVTCLENVKKLFLTKLRLSSLISRTAPILYTH